VIESALMKSKIPFLERRVPCRKSAVRRRSTRRQDAVGIERRGGKRKEPFIFFRPRRALSRPRLIPSPHPSSSPSSATLSQTRSKSTMAAVQTNGHASSSSTTSPEPRDSYFNDSSVNGSQCGGENGYHR
jgi:hypothetical protein